MDALDGLGGLELFPFTWMLGGIFPETSSGVEERICLC